MRRWPRVRPEKIEKGRPVGHGRRSGHDGLALAKPFCVQFGVRTAQTGADHHAEFPGVANPHDHLVAEGLGIRRHELNHQNPPDITGNGLPELFGSQSPVALGGVHGVTFYQSGVVLRHFVQHAPPDRTNFVRRPGDHLDPAHFGFVDDGGRHNFENHFVARHRRELFIRRPTALDQQVGARRCLGSRTGQQLIGFVLKEKIAPLGFSLGKKIGNRIEID